MNKQISDIIKQLGVTVVYDDYLEDYGKYLVLLDLIVINNQLDDFEKKKVLLHELGHACEEKNNYKLYQHTYTIRSKMENAANEYMINSIVNENEGVYNYGNFIKEFGIGMGYDEKYVK